VVPKRATSLTGAAGEHYVAYKLSALGYPTALTRGGSPVIDLMVGDLSGDKALSIQVKTSNNARRAYKRDKNKHKNHWKWDVGAKGKKLKGDSIFYAFVNLKGSPTKDRNPHPEVFIVPSEDVAKFLDRPMTAICSGSKTPIKTNI
tara:strand:- start:756 stop:1193 length:438 start_codon:yes stop_codon:yes gene_type:complete